MNIKDKNYKTISYDLLNSFPEFKSMFTPEEGNYLIFGDFSKYLMLNLDNEELMQEIGLFISKYLNTSDNEVINLIALELFQPIYAIKAEDKTIKFLDKPSRILFYKYKTGFLKKYI